MKSVIVIFSCIVSVGAFAPNACGVNNGATCLRALVKQIEVDSKTVNVYDSEAGIAEAIVETVVESATKAIESKGSFSLAIPGGSVVKALSAMSPDAFDMTKMHIFFCNERIGDNKCYKGALESFVEKCGVPLENVNKVGEEGSPSQVAADYEALIKSEDCVDQSGDIPSVVSFTFKNPCRIVQYCEVIWFTSFKLH